MDSQADFEREFANLTAALEESKREAFTMINSSQAEIHRLQQENGMKTEFFLYVFICIQLFQAEQLFYLNFLEFLSADLKTKLIDTTEAEIPQSLEQSIVEADENRIYLQVLGTFGEDGTDLKRFAGKLQFDFFCITFHTVSFPH